MESVVLQRIREVIKYQGVSDRKFSEMINIPQTSLSTLFSRGSEPKVSIISSILNAFPLISAEWLLRGEGNMIKSEDLPKISYTSGVPYYNVDFIGGFDVVLNDQTTQPDYLIDFQNYNTADCWCNVTGHSMEPEISQGDIIALKELHDWKTYIPSGEIYAIVTTEHRTIKRVSPGKHKGYILLTPSNPSKEYVAQEIPLSIVLKVYRVLGCMKRL